MPPAKRQKPRQGTEHFVIVINRLYTTLSHQFALALEDADLTGHVRSLPRFLRKFTVGSVLAYALTKCVDLLEKRRKYEEATALLRTLLAQAGLHRISECQPNSWKQTAYYAYSSGTFTD